MPLSIAACATADEMVMANLVSLYFGNSCSFLPESANNDARLLMAAFIISLFILVERVSRAPRKIYGEASMLSMKLGIRIFPVAIMASGCIFFIALCP